MRSFGDNSLNWIWSVAQCYIARELTWKSKVITGKPRELTTSLSYNTTCLNGNSVFGLECRVCKATSVDFAKIRVKYGRDQPEAWWEWRILNTPAYMCDSGNDQSLLRSHSLLPIGDPRTNRHQVSGARDWGGCRTVSFVRMTGWLFSPHNLLLWPLSPLLTPTSLYFSHLDFLLISQTRLPIPILEPSLFSSVYPNTQPLGLCMAGFLGLFRY